MPSDPPESFGCAIAQLNATLFDREANLSRVLQAIERVGRRGAKMVVFPELFLSGYLLRDRVKELAEPADGPSIRRIANAAREYRLVVVIGFPERGERGYYNAAAIINANGEMLGTYRKTHLYELERGYFTPGDEFPIFETAVGPIGVQVCFDVEFPEAPRTLALKGADLIVCIAANMEPYQKHQKIFMHARAIENHIWHIYANRVGIEDTVIFFGRSGVIDPMGEAVVQATDREGIFDALIERSRIQESYLSLNYLPNRRPDIYGLLAHSSGERREVPRGNE